MPAGRVRRLCHRCPPAELPLPSTSYTFTAGQSHYPQYVTYEGDDPDGYALMVNILRRNLTKSQLAMVAARASRMDAAARSVSTATADCS